MKKIAGLGLSGFRSFNTNDLQVLAPLGTVTLLAGQNNTGKSNVLRFAQTVVGACHGPRRPVSMATPSGLDLPSGDATRDSPLELATALHVGAEEIKDLAESGSRPLSAGTLDGLRRIFDSPALRLTNDDLMWFRFSLKSAGNGRSTLFLSEAQLAKTLEGIDQSVLRRTLSDASSRLTNQAGGQTDDLERVLDRFKPLDAVPPVQTIEAFRQVRNKGDDNAVIHNGIGLVDALAQLEKPDITQLADKGRFERINRFVRSVLDDPTVQIEIPYHRKTIHVHRNGLVLPLENLGTGIHQVVILAAAATLLSEHLVCMEEPEIHLHPILQRKLLHYLATETTNQYLIATHSAHMLDSEIASIFHVTLSETGTKVRFAAHPKDQAAICADLGYRPSDLVQVNAVIWVEGPSDRIYLRHWIGLLDPELVEGIHYSLMFYGGRLLNHLSADDPDVADFISLRRFNRHIAILIDSDKQKARAKINQTKRRVVREFDEGPGFAWVTKGYTIENYLPPRLLAAAVGEVHLGLASRWDGSLYTNPLGSEALRVTSPRADKVAIARACVRLWGHATPWPHDLEQRVRRGVDFIRTANGMEPRQWGRRAKNS